MCSLVAHDRLQDDYKDDEISIGDRAIQNDSAVKELKMAPNDFNSFTDSSFGISISPILIS